MHSYTVPLVQWFTQLLPVMRDLGSIPQGVLMWNRDSPVSLVSLHWWPRRDWSLWPRLRQVTSWTFTRPSCRQHDNPTWSHTAFLSQFHAQCRSSFWLHNQHSRLLGGALRRACNLTAFIHSSSGPPVSFPTCGTWVQYPGGYFCETGILFLALSHYNMKIASLVRLLQSWTYLPVLANMQIYPGEGTVGQHRQLPAPRPELTSKQSFKSSPQPPGPSEYPGGPRGISELHELPSFELTASFQVISSFWEYFRSVSPLFASPRDSNQQFWKGKGHFW